MPDAAWMIYGAYGFTGTLIAEEAVRRGHRPILAGRSTEKLAPLARRLGLSSMAFDLDDSRSAREAIGRVELVLNAAGPFVNTSAPMVEGCLAAGVDYLDITGELPVLRANLERDREAHDRGIAIISGMGFDVIPTDCLALHLADRLPDAIELEIAIDATTMPSGGTLVSSFQLIIDGGMVRRNGELRSYPFGEGLRRQRFTHGVRRILPLPIADLVTAYRTTGIPNITTYMSVPPTFTTLLRTTSPLIRSALRSDRMRGLMERLARGIGRAPGSEVSGEGRAHIWGRVRNPFGAEAEGWLDVPEAYRFTAIAAVRAVEKISKEKPVGALTPALALGADFILEIEGCRRFDRLDTSS